MSDIRFNQWLHQSGTGGVSQVASGAVGVGTTNPLADFYVRGDAQITGILTAGHIAMGSSITFGDDDRAYFGDGTDLQIYHSGSHSFIQDTGTGDLKIRSSNVRIEDTSGNLIINAAPTTAFLYSSGNAKLGTAGWGAQVNGIFKVLDATDSSGSTNKLSIGTGNDFNLYHDNNGDSYISNTTGHLTIRNNTAGRIINLQPKSGANGIIARYEGAAELYHNGNLKFATASTGVSITGVAGIDNNPSTDVGLRVTNNSTSAFSTSENMEGTTNRKITPLMLRNGSTSANTETYLGFDAGNTSKAQWNIGIKKTGALQGDFIFNTRTGSSTSAERLRITSSGRFLLNDISSRAVANVTAQVQLEGTTANTSAISIARNSASEYPPYLNFGKSRATSTGGTTIIQDNDSLGQIRFSGADGNDLTNHAASIEAFVDGTPGNNVTPGRLIFSTTSATGSDATEKFRISSNGQVCIGSGFVGGGGHLTIRSGGVNSYATQDYQYVGTPSNNSTTLSQIRFTANTTGASVVQGAKIQAVSDAAWSATGDSPTRLEFYTAPDGSASMQERLRITSEGQVLLSGTNSGNHMSTFGSNVGGLTIDDVGNQHTALEVSHGSNKVFLVASSNNSVYMSSYGTGNFILEHTGSGGTRERARIDSSGNFMIGSTSAEAKLDVTGGVSISSNGVTVSPSGYDLKIRSNTGKLGIHIDNSSGTPTLEFGTGNATTGGAITTNSHGIFLKPAGADKLKVEPDGIRSFANFVDTSYHANPDPFADGSGLVYYRMNYNFQDSGLYGFHGTGSQGSPNKEFNASPHFSLVNSSGEPCWDNPNEGAINIPNLKNSYPFSVAAWINVSSWPTTGDNDLIMNLSINNQRVSICICCWYNAVSDGADFYIMYGGKGHHYFRPSSKPTNTWIHVVYSVVGDDDTGHRVYQNGAELTTRGDRGGGHGGSAGWAIGGNAGNSERFAIGRIGSIRFFNKALSSSEASALYTNDTFYT